MRPWWAGSASKDVGETPWLSPAAFEFLSGIVLPEMRVLEHGCGGSTIWFALRRCQVVPVEDKPEWAVAVKRKAQDFGISERIEILDRWPAKPNELGRFDVVLIDGEPIEDRAAALVDAFELYCKPGGWVVLDNFNRPEYSKEFACVRARGAETLFYEKATKYCNTAFWHVYDEQYPVEAK